MQKDCIYPWKKFTTSLNRADGSNHAVIAVIITTAVTFKGETNPITGLIIPSLQYNLYLGIIRTYLICSSYSNL